VVRDWLDDNFQNWIGRRGRVEWVWVSRLYFQTLWPLCRLNWIRIELKWKLF
jgi:hypothetical protein